MTIGYVTGRSTSISILDLGAKCDGTTDDSLAVQQAVDLAGSLGVKVSIPGGLTRITKSIVVSRPGLIIEGSGMHFSQFIIDQSFDLSANGVFDLSSCPEPGLILRDFSIEFAQPDTSVRSNLTQYPAAIYAPNVPRFQVRSVKVLRAWNGIVMTGNSGGAIIDDLQISMFNYGVWIDGSEDTIRISKMHCWDFGLTSNQSSVFNAAGAIALYVGRVDGLFVNSLMTLCNLGMNLFQGATGDPGVYASNCGFDSYNGVKQSAGALYISSSYFSIGDASSQSIVKTGGVLNAASCEFNLGVLPTSPMIVENSSSTPENMSLVGCLFDGINFDQTLIHVQNAEVLIGTTHFSRFPNTSYTTPVVSKSGGRLTMTGCSINDQGSGSCTFIDVSSADNFDFISGNMAPGRPSTFPVVAGSGYYDDGSVYTGSVASPAMPASGTALNNPFNAPTRVFIGGGTVTSILINGVSTNLTSGMFVLGQGENITINYTAAPTWEWMIVRI